MEGDRTGGAEAVRMEGKEEGRKAGRKEGGLLHHVRHGLMDSKLKLRARPAGKAEPITFPPKKTPID